MKCLMCESLSLSHICKECQELFLTPSIYKRKIFNNIEVISFYKYNDIKSLLHTKHTDLGYYVYNILAKNSFLKFAKEFNYPEKIVSIPIDDAGKSGYSHTAILNKHLNSKNIKTLFNKLRAQSSHTYSGKSKEYRLLHPKNFQVSHFKENDVILVDDIITTGSTLKQAISTLNAQGKNVLFCLTLADVEIKER